VRYKLLNRVRGGAPAANAMQCKGIFGFQNASHMATFLVVYVQCK